MKPSPFLEFQQIENTVEQAGTETGRRLVISATANDGEYYTPVRVFNAKQAKSVFQGGPLVECAVHVFKEFEGIDIVLIRMEPKIYMNLFKCLDVIDFDLVYIDEPLSYEDEEDLWSFIEMAKRKENQGHLIHGAINIPTDDYVIRSTEDLIKSFSFESEAFSEEYGKYLSFVVDQFSGGRSALDYMAWLTLNDPEVSPLNKTFNRELEHVYEKDEIYGLRQKGFVCFRESILKGVVCASCTAAVETTGSVHKNISNFRIAQFFFSEIADQLHSSIGEMNPEMQARKIKEKIDEIIISFQRMQRIKEASYSFLSNDFRGEIQAYIDLVPIFATTSITGKASMRIFR